VRILITGGAGYIGSHTAKEAARAGHTPIVVDNLEHGHRWAVKWGPLIEADLSNRPVLRDVFARQKVDAVIHFAAYIAVGESVGNPARYFRNNVANALNLFEAGVEAGVRDFVFSSTAAVYGDPIQVPIPEEHPAAPVSPYGESKLMGERILEWFERAYGIRSARLRYFNASGADPDGEIGEEHNPETHLIPLAIGAALGRRGPLELYGTDYDTQDGTAIRDYIHVTDLARAHLGALEYIRRHSRSIVCNLGTGKGYTVREVIQTVERVGRVRVPVRESPRRPGDAPALIADATRARNELNWAPELSSLETIVATAWAWQKNRRG
jgi:UDP-glucose 4-epimerase/UDP-arabinose 4-epimerase